MAIKQLSVFVENKQGKLAEITRMLAEGGINMRALSIADTRDFGILRLIVNDTETYRIQEKHLPIYHLYCMCLENEFYGE